MLEPINPFNMKEPFPPGLFVGVVRQGTMELVRELSPAELSRYQVGEETLAEFAHRDRLFSIVGINLSSFLDAANKVAERVRNMEQVTAQAVEESHVETGRWIHNLLSSFGTYLDLTAKHLARAHGKNSGYYKAFKDAQSEEYDAHFSYRFFCRLRNYSQHREMPLGKLELTRNWLEVPFFSVSEFKVLFSREELLAHKGVWGKQVKGELEAEAESFDVIPHAVAAVQCLARIHGVSLADIRRSLVEAVAVVSETLGDAVDDEGEPYILTSPQVDRVAGKYNLTAKQTPRYLLARVRKLFENVPAP